ncbi:TetR/AcrR family transcriptional regulator [Desulfovibrio inopinatus]|uniref:TetR/AcrR family transcriptional regulator n=1 Tax=Desulfovibrio inopinatus TaxID=102109 RepID=UPI0004077670|nr:TetR/AcrR family transcriptional regulator [Desulfovibrio inopinatus]
MSIEERKERDRQIMRRKILDAARVLFVREGFDNVTMRRIARRIEYSPAALYRYFQNKADLLQSLRIEGFDMLNHEMLRNGNEPDPMKRLRQLALVYVRFACDNPEYYELMFNAGDPTSVEQGWPSEPMQAFGMLQNVVMAAMAEGAFNNVDLETAVFGIWSSCHGLANLVVKNRLANLVGDEHVDELVEKIVDFGIYTSERGTRARKSAGSTLNSQADQAASG